MAMFCVRIPDHLAAGFDDVAAGEGGRSALLRRLIGETAKGKSGSAPAQTRRPVAARLMVRLGPDEAAHVERDAARMCLSRAGWVSALVRRHATGRPTFPRPDEVALIGIHGEIRRIGVNVNQIARALNTAVVEGRALELEMSDLEAFRQELRAHMAALREAFEGNLAYWDALRIPAVWRQPEGSGAPRSRP